MTTGRAFTLVEIVVVVAIISVLVALLFGGMGVVRQRARTAATQTLVTQVHQACLVYQGEDKKRRFPPACSDFVLYADIPDQGRTWDGAVPLAGSMLDVVGLKLHSDGSKQLNGRWALADAWGQPLHYHVDALADSTIDRPKDGASQQVQVPGDVDDWNPTGIEPYAYVWSCGRPLSGSTLKDKITSWIYVRERPRP